MLNARRMFEALKPFDPEFIEQPVSASTGPEGLARLRAVTDIPDRRRPDRLLGRGCL